MSQRVDQLPDRHHTRASTQPRQVLTLRLQPEPAPVNDNRVTWDPNVSENVQQRVSKCCCVFHRKRVFGESDSDTSSSSSSSDSDGDQSAAASRTRKLADTADEAPSGNSACCDGQHAHDDHHVAKKKHRRPKCTKESCLCGTRFS
jgi:protein phosphatase 1 regulatory subunit 11